LNWINAINNLTSGEVIAVDGKTLRHSYDKKAGSGAIHMVSAWATQNRLVLGQIKVDKKSSCYYGNPRADKDFGVIRLYSYD